MDSSAGPFPESDFPCHEESLEDYLGRIEAGVERMRTTSVVICGLARDVEEVLPATIARIELLGRRFRDFRVVIVENDSRDSTPEILKAWRDRDPAVTVISERLGLPSWGQVRSLDRAAQLASCRNKYLDHALEQHRDCQYAIFLDTDFPEGFSQDGIAHSFGHDDWDAIGSYAIQFRKFRGIERYPVFFDVWAFREVGRPGDDNGPPMNARTFRRGDPILPVSSCFGGLMLYRMEALASGARYNGSDCEHVTIHSFMRQKGFDRIAFNPSQIVLVPPPSRPCPDELPGPTDFGLSA
jgi:hypothetical protein